MLHDPLTSEVLRRCIFKHTPEWVGREGTADVGGHPGLHRQTHWDLF